MLFRDELEDVPSVKYRRTLDKLLRRNGRKPFTRRMRLMRLTGRW